MLNIEDFKIRIRYDEFLAHPALTSIFVVLFFTLSFARLPGILYMLILAVEIYIAMLFGARFAATEKKEGEADSPAPQTAEKS
ncbi:MAG: hypothetical protein JXR29_02915 [Methylothermaceae bacterium]|nr:hypothetical protein [Methylothermaceae bacterium]